MSSKKQFDVKLKSLRNTEKMARTMKLVAMSKLYRSQENQRRAKFYAQNLQELIRRLAATVDSAIHPLFVARPSVKNVLILVMTSDKGLCGSFNNSLCKGVRIWIENNKGKYQQIDLSFCGKRGWMFFRKLVNVRTYYEGVTARPDFTAAKKIGTDVSEDFLNGRYDEVYLAYNIYHSPLSQTATFEKILPVEPQELVTGGKKIPTPYIFEPPEKELFEFLVPKYMFFKIYYALLENAAGEHAARMTAMDSASKNAKELIDHYTLLRNRARQAAITKELIEIVSGAEALKG